MNSSAYIVSACRTPIGSFQGALSPLSAPELLLQINLSNLSPGSQDNVGLDNLRFGQNPPGVPEPGSLLLATLAAVLWSCRRKACRVESLSRTRSVLAP